MVDPPKDFPTDVALARTPGGFRSWGSGVDTLSDSVSCRRKKHVVHLRTNCIAMIEHPSTLGFSVFHLWTSFHSWSIQVSWSFMILVHVLHLLVLSIKSAFSYVFFPVRLVWPSPQNRRDYGTYLLERVRKEETAPHPRRVLVAFVHRRPRQWISADTRCKSSHGFPASLYPGKLGESGWTFRSETANIPTFGCQVGRKAGKRTIHVHCSSKGVRRVCGWRSLMLQLECCHDVFLLSVFLFVCT